MLQAGENEDGVSFLFRGIPNLVRKLASESGVRYHGCWPAMRRRDNFNNKLEKRFGHIFAASPAVLTI